MGKTRRHSSNRGTVL